MSLKQKVKDRLIWQKYNKYRKLLNAENKNLNIFGPIVIKNPEGIEIGQNCRLNDHAFIHGAGGVKIGDEVTISAYAKVISWGYDTTDWPSNYIKKDHVPASIHLGKGCWIGAGAIVLPGVRLTGEGIIVAAGSVVTKSFNGDFLLIGGNPARIIKRYEIVTEVSEQTVR